tara:strand:+ start:2500 stop:3171 length:672 start_codon:yes stop_codon:yes gene_type:complete
MASVVLQQDSALATNGGALLPVDTLFSRSIHAGAGGIQSDGALTSLAGGFTANEGVTNIRTANGIQISASTPGAVGSSPTSYQTYVSATPVGALLANQQQLWGTYDAALSSPTSLEFQRARPVLIGGTAAATASVAVIQPLNQPAPVNWFGAGFAGQLTGTGAPLVVAVPGIPATAIIRYMLVGVAAGGAAVAAPTAISVQGNVSFTITATVGAIYNWEILFN